jgi:hypothetical protein
VPAVVNGEDTYVMVPELCRRFCKLGWTVSALPKNCQPVERLKGNELGNVNNSLMPISRVFTKYYSELDCKASVLHEYRCHSKLEGECQLSIRVWDWMEQVYGVSKEEIDELESFLWSHLVAAGGRPSVWDHPTARKLYHHYKQQ